MTAKILSGKEFATQFKQTVCQKAHLFEKKYGLKPGLAVIIVGKDPASAIYVRNKHRACAETNIRSQIIELDESVSKKELLAVIDSLNKNQAVHGILLQLPLPKHLAKDGSEILSRIDPLKDVDGFHPLNVGRLSLGEDCLVPCTALGCLRLLEAAKIPLEGKRAVIVGRSNIVGKPLFHLLLQKNATVTICHSRTENLPSITKTADILIAAVGKPHFITSAMVKEKAAVIDVGINRIAPKKLVGDVAFEQVAKKAAFITPVPGGIGLLTIASLMENTLKAACLQITKRGDCIEN